MAARARRRSRCSTCAISNLDRKDLDQISIFRRIPLLFAPYYLEDGANQYGVAVADMAVRGVRAPYDPGKPSVIHSLAMRLILDYAKNTDEALELLKQYNIYFVMETCHLMIADATGKSVVVEFINGEMKTTPTHENWQVCTNHQICGKSEAENCACCKRYKAAAGELAAMKSGHQPRRRDEGHAVGKAEKHDVVQRVRPDDRPIGFRLPPAL